MLASMFGGTFDTLIDVRQISSALDAPIAMLLQHEVTGSSADAKFLDELETTLESKDTGSMTLECDDEPSLGVSPISYALLGERSPNTSQGQPVPLHHAKPKVSGKGALKTYTVPDVVLCGLAS